MKSLFFFLDYKFDNFIFAFVFESFFALGRCKPAGAVLGSTLARYSLSFTSIDHAFISRIPRFGYSLEIGPDWEL